MNRWTINLWRLTLVAAALLSLVAPSVSTAAPASEASAVPPELEPWIEWVKTQDLPPGECRDYEETMICVWPTRLSLNVDDAGGSFELEVTAHDAQSVLLPGDDLRWPQDVRVDGEPVVVADNGGEPTVRLSVGRHRVSGKFLWERLPDSLTVPPEIALVELKRRGTAAPFPERQEGLLRLLSDDEIAQEDLAQEDPEDAEEALAEDALRVEVSRWLRDGVPLAVTTRIDLHVSGKARELTLPYPLWDDAELLRVDSGLPLQLGEGRELVLQARAGTYAITIESALPRQPETLAPPELAQPWPDDEVWVWKAAAAGEAALGQVALSGGLAVDRSRTHAPEEWEGGATFRVDLATPLAFEVLQRGVSETAPNELTLDREMLFELSGDGWSVVDRVQGQMHRGSRLDLLAGALGSVTISDTPQVVTRGADGATGVEVRRTDLDLRATWRSDDRSSTLPLGGWSEPFDRVSLSFELPRGWDVLRAKGPGSMRSTWLESWRPLELVMLLGVCVLLGRLISPWLGVTALLGLGLAYTRNGDGYLALVALIALLAVLAVWLRRERGLWATRAMQSLWVLSALLLGAWMIWSVPLGLSEVWRDGTSALAHRDLERELGDLAKVELIGVMLFLLAHGLGWLVVRARRWGRKPMILVASLTGAVALVMLVMWTLTAGMLGDATRSDASYDEGPVEEWAKRADDEAGGQGQRHKGEEGVMGRPSPKTSQKQGLYAVEAVIESEESEDRDGVWDGISGEEVGEAYGVGGLGLVGTGAGGGGTGEGTIGLGNTGLIGKGGGGGYGRGSGVGFGGRGKSVPRVRQAKATVEGALDRDIIRRIVRAHINEVRYCYSQGLSRDPSLGGRVAIRFSIGSAGKVTTSSVQENTLADGSVGACVAKAVKRWKFPKPKGGGTVDVAYPFVLSSDGGGGAPTGAANERYVLESDLPKAPPSAVAQTGEGTPEWSGGRWSLDIDRSVKPDETVSLWLVSPAASKALALVRALALWALGFFLVRAGVRAGWRRRSIEREDPDGGPSKIGGGAALVALLCVFFGAPQIASAAPTPELLEELKRRVNEEGPLAPSPECAPECAMVSKLDVDIAGQVMKLRAEVHMQGPGIYALPGSFDGWMPSSVDVDGRPAQELIAINGAVLVRLAEGVHIVALSGPIGGDEFNIGLNMEPKRVEVKARGWIVDGVDEDGRADSLHLLREAGAGADGPADVDDPDAKGEPEVAGERASQELPAWLSVHRQLVIGPRWTMTTSVTRRNHGPSPITVQVPLLDGEKMLEATAKVGDPKSTISFESAGETITWTSVLEPRAELVLTAPQGSPWTEIWTVTCGEAWQCAMTGAPATRRDAGTSVFHPWPGEQLSLALHEPTPIDGALVLVERADLRLGVAESGTEASLSMSVRAATVTTRTLTIPEGARLGSVKIAGVDVPMAKDATELRLTFQPGQSEVSVEWKHDDASSTVYRTPAVLLGGQAVNTRLTVDLEDGSDRVVLWATGSGTGPFVWLWAWFGVVAGLAVMLGRIPGAPLKTWQWCLLGLGFSAGLLPAVILWFFVVSWRAGLAQRLTSDRSYNAMQFGYILMTLAVVVATLATCKELLTTPVWTHLENGAHGGGQLSWYSDRSADAMPSAWILSAPTSLWRAVWALWVLTIAWLSISWGRWAWRLLGDGGWLRAPAPVLRTESVEPEEAAAPTAKEPVDDGSSATAETPVNAETEVSGEDGA